MMIRTEALRVPASSLCRSAVVSLIAVALSGCLWVEDTADLKEFVAKTQARPSGQIEPLPEFKPYESFVYEGSSLRNPFEPLIPAEEADEVVGNGSEIKPDDDRPKDYLETFAIDQLKMVGTITPLDQQGLLALVRDNKGEIHRVALGDHMGLDYGQVTEITDDVVKLVEIISDGRGGWMKRPRNLAMPTQE